MPPSTTTAVRTVSATPVIRDRRGSWPEWPGPRVGLHRTADAERGQHAEQGKQHGQPLDAQAALDVVHGAAAHLALVVGDAVLDGQHGLAVLGGHAEEGSDPTSEHGARGRRETMAVATPAMLPVPMVAESAVISAPKWLMSPSWSFSCSLGREGLLQRQGQHVDRRKSRRNDR